MWILQIFLLTTLASSSGSGSTFGRLRTRWPRRSNPSGQVGSSERMPSSHLWTLNQLHFIGATSVADVIASDENRQADLPYRHVVVRDDATAHELDPRQ